MLSLTNKNFVRSNRLLASVLLLLAIVSVSAGFEDIGNFAGATSDVILSEKEIVASSTSTVPGVTFHDTEHLVVQGDGIVDLSALKLTGWISTLTFNATGVLQVNFGSEVNVYSMLQKLEFMRGSGQASIAVSGLPAFRFVGDLEVDATLESIDVDLSSVEAMQRFVYLNESPVLEAPSWLHLPALQLVEEADIACFRHSAAHQCPWSEGTTVKSLRWTSALPADVAAAAACVRLPKVSHSATLHIKKDDTPRMDAFVNETLRDVVSVYDLTVSCASYSVGSDETQHSIVIPNLRWVVELTFNLQTNPGGSPAYFWDIRLPRVEAVGSLTMSVAPLLKFGACAAHIYQHLVLGGSMSQKVETLFFPVAGDGDGGGSSFANPNIPDVPQCPADDIIYGALSSHPNQRLKDILMPPAPTQWTSDEQASKNMELLLPRLYGASCAAPETPELVFVVSVHTGTGTGFLLRPNSLRETPLSLPPEASISAYLSAVLALVPGRIIETAEFTAPHTMVPFLSKGYAVARCRTDIDMSLTDPGSYDGAVAMTGRPSDDKIAAAALRMYSTGALFTLVNVLTADELPDLADVLTDITLPPTQSFWTSERYFNFTVNTTRLYASPTAVLLHPDAQSEVSAMPLHLQDRSYAIATADKLPEYAMSEPAQHEVMSNITFRVPYAALRSLTSLGNTQLKLKLIWAPARETTDTFSDMSGVFSDVPALTMNAHDPSKLSSGGTFSPSHVLQADETVTYEFTAHVAGSNDSLSVLTLTQSAGDTVAFPSVLWQDLDVTSADLPLLGAVTATCVLTKDGVSSYICPPVLLSDLRVGSTPVASLDMNGVRNESLPQDVCQMQRNYVWKGESADLANSPQLWPIGDVYSDQTLTVKLPFHALFDTNANAPSEVFLSESLVHPKDSGATTIDSVDVDQVSPEFSTPQGLLWQHEVDFVLRDVPTATRFDSQLAFALGFTTDDNKVACDAADSLEMRLEYFSQPMSFRLLTLPVDGGLGEVTEYSRTTLEFDLGQQVRRSNHIPPAGRLALEVLTQGVRDTDLEVVVNGTTRRSFLRVTCAGEKKCDDVDTFRYLADFSAGEEELSLAVRLSGAGASRSVRLLPWPVSGQLDSARTRYLSPWEAPFSLVALRNANEESGLCTNDVNVVQCGVLGEHKVQCLTVSKCPVDVDFGRDWIVVAGVGFALLHRPDILVAVRVKNRYVLQGEKTDWDQEDLDTFGGNVVFGLRFVELGEPGSIDALVGVPEDVKTTLRTLDTNMFGYASEDGLDVETGVVAVMPIPDNLGEYNMEVGMKVFLRTLVNEALGDSAVSFGETLSTHVAGYACSGCSTKKVEFESLAWTFESTRQHYQLLSYNGAFFVQFTQVGKHESGGRDCETGGNIVRGCERSGGNKMQLMAFNLNTEALYYGIRLMYEGQAYYSKGYLSIGVGVAESQAIEFALPTLPAYMPGDAVFDLHVLSVSNDTTNASVWQTDLPNSVYTGFQLAYAVCPNHTGPSLDPGNYAGCVPCGQGQVSHGGKACEQCPPGKFGLVEFEDSVATRSECLPCGAYSFSNTTGQMACHACFGSNVVKAHGDGGFVPVTGLATCEQCPAGQYTPRAHGIVQGPCQICPEGVDCSDGQVRAQQDYWIDWNRDSGTVGAYRCKTGEHCMAGQTCEEQRGVSGELLPLTCCGPNRQSADSNRLCGECLDGYYEWGDSCIKCDSNGSVVGNLLLLVFVYLVYVEAVHYLAQNLRDASVRIMLYYVQMSKLFAGAIDVSLTGWLAKLFFGLFSLDIVAVTGGSMCYGRVSPMSRIWMSALTPVFTMGMLGFLLVVRLVVTRCLSRVVFDLQDMLSAFRRTALYLLIGSYAAVLDVVIQVVFGCTDAGLDGKQVLKQHPSVSCDSSGYQTTRVLMAIIGLLYGLGIPAWLFFIMRRRLQRSKLFTLEAQRVIGVLTEVYRPRVYYWEALVLMRRTILLVIVFVNVNSNQTDRMLFLSGLATTVFLVLQLLVWPYRRVSDNLMEMVVLFAHRMTVLGLATAEQPMTQTQSNLFAAWVLVSTLFLVSCLVAVKSLSWRRRRGEQEHLFLENGDIDIHAVRVVKITSTSSLPKRMLSLLAECFTCAPLTRLRIAGGSLDQVLATRLVTVADFRVFELGGGDLRGQTVYMVLKSAEVDEAHHFFGGLRTLRFDCFDVERNEVMDARAAVNEFDVTAMEPEDIPEEEEEAGAVEMTEVGATSTGHVDCADRD